MLRGTFKIENKGRYKQTWTFQNNYTLHDLLEESTEQYTPTNLELLKLVTNPEI